VDKIYIDIETIPGQDEWIKEESASKVSPPGNMSKPETIQKWWSENGDEAIDTAWRKTALDGSLGEIICISWAINNGDPIAVYRNSINDNEGEMLTEFFANMKSVGSDSKWIGHYITGFDLRFIWQRSVINRVKPTINIPYAAKPWEDNVFDTKIEWSGAQSTGTGTLDSVCKALGYDGKGDIDGSKVWDYVKQGRIEEVVEYCKDDVIKARLIHKRMTFEG